MPSTRRVRATFTGVDPGRIDSVAESGARSAGGDSSVGVYLEFRPAHVRLDVDLIRDFASLGPDLCVPSVEGLGKVLRILRSARIAAPSDPHSLLGDVEAVSSLLERAIGTLLILELRPRSRIRFVAWTEDGIQTIEDVTEVLEAPDAYLVARRRGRFPVRVPRSSVVRQRTELEPWYEVIAIERAS